MNPQQHSSNFLTPQSFNNMPNNEVNWAQLAQRWIYTHQQQSHQHYQPQPPPVPPQNPSGYQHYGGNYHAPPATVPRQIPPLLPPGHGGEHPPPGPRQFFPQPPPLARFPAQPHPGIYAQSRPPPLNQWGGPPPAQQWPQSASNQPIYPPRYPQMGASSSHSGPPPPITYPTANYGNPITVKKPDEEEEYQAHYDPSLEQDEDADSSAQNQSESQPPEGAMGHWLTEPMWGAYPANYVPVIGKNNKKMIKFRLDTQMRKKLPSWILEGLEKAEKEKQKKLEKEEQERQQRGLEEERRKKREEKGLGKFDSDSESEDEERAREGEDVTEAPRRKFREFVDPEVDEDGDERTEEERKQEAVELMRKLMLSVLLDTTSREFVRLGEEVLAKEKLKAQPKILAKSSALAALSSSFIGDDDEEEDDSSSNDGEAGQTASSPQKNTNLVASKSEAGRMEMEKSPSTQSMQSAVVFKVPMAPQPKSVKKEPELKAPKVEQAVEKHDKDGSRKRDKRSPDSGMDRKRDRRERSPPNRDHRDHGRDRKDDESRSSSRSSNGNGSHRDRDSSDRDRDRDRVRERDRRRRSRSRSRSPRDRKHRSSHRERSPRR